MAAHAASAPQGGLTLTIRGKPYPVLLPKVSDPRLHLAAVITTLQVLGQTVFDFRLSIAQILISLLTCAVLEVAITFRKQHVLMWPASALLTGNGVAFILRVPGTQHGDWWSLRGWWIFAATAAVSLLSKYVIVWRGGHVFNPSNIGLVLCFLALGPERAEPLDFWWGPMSPWLGLAFAVIVAGGLLILSRLRLLRVAVGFWLSFGVGIAVLALIGHGMTARWHLGPITGFSFWWALLSSPEVLVFLFFMITDPKTSPRGPTARVVYAVSVGLLAALLIAPTQTEYASKVALLAALAIVCALRPLVEFLPLRFGPRNRLAFAAAGGLAVYSGALALAGLPARSAGAPAVAEAGGPLPRLMILPSRGVESKLDVRTARGVARDLLADLRRREQAEIRVATRTRVAVPTFRIDRMSVWLEPGAGQDPATVVARIDGVKGVTAYAGSPPAVVGRAAREPFHAAVRLRLDGSRYVIAQGLAGAPAPVAAPTERLAARRAAARGFEGVRLTNVARQVGLDFRQGAFRFGVVGNDVHSMMGGGLCWLDYNDDGWLDLFVVNSYSDADVATWNARGRLPQSALFENLHGRFANVSAPSHANIAVQGNGCVAADFNGDDYTDLLVTTNTYNVLLWNNGNGTFTNGTHAAGIDAFGTYGWHTGAAVADVNGDGRPDIFVSGYANVSAPVQGSSAGFPLNYQAFRSLLYLNEGPDARGRSRFRDVALQAGIERRHVDHSLGAVFTDVNGDGRADLYVANDLDPNRLYVNEPGGPLGFRFVERGRMFGVADRNAGMGIAMGDYSGDGRPDLFVSNSRGQTHAVFRSRGASLVDGRSAFAAALGKNLTGWGDSWVDLNNDGNLDLVVANGAIPVTNLARDAGPVQVLENLTGEGLPGHFAAAGALVGLNRIPHLNGRGVAAADYDNDGQVDVAINTIGGQLVLLRSSGAAGHWLEVALARFSPGTTVTAVLPDGHKLVREVVAGSSYLSSEDPRVHFGLGDAPEVRELVVRSRGGVRTRLRHVAADRIVAVG